MIAANPKDWFAFLGIKSDPGADLVEQIVRQRLLLEMAKHPHVSHYRGGRVPKSYATRLNQLKCPDGNRFDPELPKVALRIMEKGLIAATQNMGSKLVLDTVLGIESEEELNQQWSSWLKSGSFWPKLLRMHWHSVLVHAADGLLVWAREEGVDKIDGGKDAVEALAYRLRQLTPKDVVPSEWGDAVENASVTAHDHDW